MSEKCKETIFGKFSWHGHRCTRNAIKDGFCKQHHPDSVAERRAASFAKYEEDLKKSPRVRLIGLQEKYDALTASHAALLAALERVRQNIPNTHICCECPRADGFDMEPECCADPDRLHDVIDVAIKAAKELG